LDQSDEGSEMKGGHAAAPYAQKEIIPLVDVEVAAVGIAPSIELN